jgi:1-acyl-sn-glycerol-3-phosphate acyltransferase
MQRYFTEPYRFIPPHRGMLWCRLAKTVFPRYLARSVGVARWECRGAEHLARSVRDGAGIVLAANHCRWGDGPVLARLGVELGLFFYYLVSYHMFRQSRAMGWWINRLGCYSIWREGADRVAIRATADVLAAAGRPVVIFPEGTWYRQNDRLGPLQDGLTLMFRLAAKRSERPLRVHPVAIKYWNLDDPRPVLAERLARLETRLGWQPQQKLELVARIEKLGSALVSVKEVEYLGRPQSGPLDGRIAGLVENLVGGLEKYHLGRGFDGHPMERIRRLRLHLARRLLEFRDDADEVARVRQNLDMLLFCENLNAQSLDYLRELPSAERLSETVQRIEETVDDGPEEPAGGLGAVVDVGPALDARTFPDAGRNGTDPLMRELSAALQGQLDDLLAQGPPAAWNCPPPFGARLVPEGSCPGS